MRKLLCFSLGLFLSTIAVAAKPAKCVDKDRFENELKKIQEKIGSLRPQTREWLAELSKQIVADAAAGKDTEASHKLTALQLLAWQTNSIGACRDLIPSTKANRPRFQGLEVRPDADQKRTLVAALGDDRGRARDLGLCHNWAIAGVLNDVENALKGKVDKPVVAQISGQLTALGDVLDLAQTAQDCQKRTPASTPEPGISNAN